jgi:ribose transport system ATP-binding protein
MNEAIQVPTGPFGEAPAEPRRTAEVALELRGLEKRFGGTQALAEAHLTVRRGTVHALLGGNGSGKSTTIKILAGVYTADAGDLTLMGQHYPLQDYSAATARAAGLRFVHQDLGLFEELSIEENFALDAGYPQGRSGRIHWGTLRQRVREILADYDLDVDPRARVGDLRPGDRTMVAIARALQVQEENRELVLVLDEPTASLAQAESELLLERIRNRAQRGQTVIIVSHRMQEVLSVAQDFTVFRDGQVAGTLTNASPTEEEIVEMMAGGLVSALRPSGSSSHSTGRSVLEVRQLTGGPLGGVDLTVHEGEIVGIAGLAGSGRSSLLKHLFGTHRPTGGTMHLDGRPYTPRHVEEAMDAGVALVPEDRACEAAFPDRTVSENLASSVLRENWSTRWMSRAKEGRTAAELIRRFAVKVGGPDALFTSMSGGNQQKVVLARWLQRNPRLLLLDEPTQGVDIMSRTDIYSTIRNTARDGCAVLVASSDMSELHALCDRIVFLRQGRNTEIVDAAQLEVDDLTKLLMIEPKDTHHVTDDD